MEIVKCPECRQLRLFEDGKCTNCGYCSSVRASINALHSHRRPSKYEEFKARKRSRVNK
ncbi:hypothetical protein [Neobacillus vireti]|uniref:hypothetical protein n=1 Tax=Neobacillus vireti TaxID=220686 RepID=UPI002FFEC36C